MRARRIIEGAAFGPEVIEAARAAFDAAWAEIADRFGTELREAARERLATAIISAARENSTNVDMLRRVGLDAMARDYPQRLAARPPRDEANGTDD